MRETPYIKIEGAGNICLVVEREAFSGSDDELREFVRAICARDTGKSADQFLEVQSRHPLRFQIWNADGSKAGMCGNGSRAILRLAEEEGWFPSPVSPGQKLPFIISGRECTAERLTEAGMFEVNLGQREVGERQEIFFDGTRVPYWPVDVGNKHAVIFAGSRQGDWKLPKDFSLNAWGPKLCDALRANIEFVVSLGGKRNPPGDHPSLQVLVWEIGAGPTLACGSGAVAVAAAWQRRNKSLQSQFSIEMAGGKLEVRLTPADSYLSGPSSIVERGAFPF